MPGRSWRKKTSRLAPESHKTMTCRNLSGIDQELDQAGREEASIRPEVDDGQMYYTERVMVIGTWGKAAYMANFTEVGTLCTYICTTSE